MKWWKNSIKFVFHFIFFFEIFSLLINRTLKINKSDKLHKYIGNISMRCNSLLACSTCISFYRQPFDANHGQMWLLDDVLIN